MGLSPGLAVQGLRSAGPGRRKPAGGDRPGLHRLSVALQKRRAALHSAGRFRAAGRHGRRAGATVFPVARVAAIGESKLAQADKHTNIGMLRSLQLLLPVDRQNYYKEHFVRSIGKSCWLTACSRSTAAAGVQRHAPGADPTDAELPLRQAHAVSPLVLADHRQTDVRRHQADHIAADQHANLVSFAAAAGAKRRGRTAAFEGISMGLRRPGLGAGATESGIVVTRGNAFRH